MSSSSVVDTLVSAFLKKGFITQTIKRKTPPVGGEDDAIGGDGGEEDAMDGNGDVSSDGFSVVDGASVASDTRDDSGGNGRGTYGGGSSPDTVASTTVLSAIQKNLYATNLDEFAHYYRRPLNEFERIVLGLEAAMVAEQPVGNDTDALFEYTKSFIKFLDFTAQDTDGRWQLLVNYWSSFYNPSNYPRPLFKVIESFATIEAKLVHDTLATRLVQSSMPPQISAAQAYNRFGDDDYYQEGEEEDGEEQLGGDAHESTEEKEPSDAEESPEEGAAGATDTEVDPQPRLLSGGETPPTQNELMMQVSEIAQRTIKLVTEGTDTLDASWKEERTSVVERCASMLSTGDHNPFSHSYDYLKPGDEGGTTQLPYRNYYHIDDKGGENTASANDDVVASFRRMCLLIVSLILSTKANTDTLGPETTFDSLTILPILNKTHAILLTFTDKLGKTTDLETAYEVALVYNTAYKSLYNEIYGVLKTVSTNTSAASAPLPTIAIFASAMLNVSHMFMGLLFTRGCLGRSWDRYQYPSSENIYTKEEEMDRLTSTEQMSND